MGDNTFKHHIDMLRSYQRIVELVEQKEPPTRDEVQKACDAYNKAVHRYLESKHTIICKNQ